MTKFHFTIVLILSLFFASCAGSSKQFIEEGYENGSETGSLSLLTIQKDQFNGDFSDHTFGELRTNEVPIFESYLTTFLTGIPQAEIKGELTQVDFRGSNFEPREFETNSKTLNVLAPRQGTILREESIESRYVIILDNYRFDQYEEIRGNDSYAGHEPEVIPRMMFKTKYVIWDNEVGNAVAWGEVESDRRIEMNRMEEIYEELLVESFTKMVEASPFPS